METKQCPICSEHFIADKPSSKLCSVSCRNESLRTLTKLFNCKECGKEFNERAKSRANNIFCSRECSFKNIHDNKLTDEEKRVNARIKFSKLYRNKCIECNTKKGVNNGGQLRLF